MHLDRNTVVVGVAPRISRDRFRELLVRRGSPAAPEADASYDAIVKRKVDPLFALAVAEHESWMCTHPDSLTVTFDLKNPGATRSTTTGVGEVIQIPGRGPFVRYPSYSEGFADLANRLVKKGFNYEQAGADTVAEIIPIWAPKTDNNDPEAYIAAVLADMNRWLHEVPFPDAPHRPITVPTRVQHIPSGNPNRPGERQPQTRFVVVHQTGNPNPGADAAMHARFVGNGGGAEGDYEGVSFHWAVDDREAVELLPWRPGVAEVAWHASDGSGPGNYQSVAIESCVHYLGMKEPQRSAVRTKTLDNTAQLVALILKAHGLGIDAVKQHHDFARDRKDCPRQFRGDGTWDDLLALVASYLHDEPEASEEFFALTGQRVAGGFYRYWKRYGGIPIFGYPLTGEFTENGLTVQYFERARLEWHPTDGHGSPDDWHVLPGLVGSELTKQKRDLRAFRPVPKDRIAPDAEWFEATGHSLRGAFRLYWHEYGGLKVFGYPLSEEFRDEETGLIVQWFERARFEWHGERGATGMPYDVLLGRVGAELLDRKR